MSGSDPSYPASSSSQKAYVKENTTSTSTQPADGSAMDVSMARRIYYPCFGNVDVKSYIDARVYGLSFRRLHDEWVVLGSPRMDTRHWPRLAGHGGFPTGPEDFVNVAEYYDRKLFQQVLFEAQGKPADRDRPMDDFIIAMVTTSAIVLADFVLLRLERKQPSISEAAAQHTWYQSFTAYLHDCVSYFVKERSVCHRLGAHNCVVPLIYGQAQPMSLPDLIQNFDYQVQIFQNLFPNFGDHINRCAAARPQQQRSPTSVSTASRTRDMEVSSNQFTGRHEKARAPSSHSSCDKQDLYRSRLDTGVDFDRDDKQQESARNWNVAHIPADLEGRSDLFLASIDPAIRCDVPLEQVVKRIDSHLTTSASTSTSSTSTPASVANTTPYSAAQLSSGVSPAVSGPSSESDWKMRARREPRDDESTAAGLGSTNLTLRAPLQSNSWWAESISGRATSEEGSMVTPEEAMAAHTGRAHSNSTASYFSSLPVTPTTMYPPGSLLSPQEGSQLYQDQFSYGSRAGLLTMTSTSDPDSRKRSRAEQNRDKMKAYHRRVMQQREALTSILTDMAVHVGPVPMPSHRLDERSMPSSVGLESQTPAGMLEDASGTAMTSSFGRSSQEPGWPVSLRNKQKQESKARLRRREIDQVHELGQYARFARTMLRRVFASDPLSPTTGASSSGAIKIEDEQSSSASALGRLQAQQVSNIDVHRSQAIVRVFQRQRPNWIALISAEQRLASEVAKLWPSTEEDRMDGGAASASDREGAGKEIKALLDRIQTDERAGLLPVPVAESTFIVSGSALYDSQSSMVRGSGGTMTAGALMTPAVAGKSRSATFQPYADQGGHGPAGLMQGAPHGMSPSSSDYGAVISPSGVTRPAGADEGGDYFTQERRRYQEQYAEGSGGSIAEQHIGAYASRMPPSGMHRSSGLAPSVLAPSVLSPIAGYGYAASYASTGAQGIHRAAAAMSTSPAQPISALDDAQLRMSTLYNQSSYGATMMQAAAPASRPDQRAGVYHSQILQTPSVSYATALNTQSEVRYEAQQQQGLQASGSASMLLQYQSSQPASPQYPPGQQSPYGEHPPYSGGQ